MKRKVIILGAGGRDFHNFNTFFRDNESYEVVCFTAAQIPGISGRKYPKELAGKLYPRGIPIVDEKDLSNLIKKHGTQDVVLSYSDLSFKDVMDKASLSIASGANFMLLGPSETQLKSKKKVIAICAVRTGAGKSSISEKICDYLKARGKKFVVIRHPMPYGDLSKQTVQRFASLADLDKQDCTIEEREEYEHYLEKKYVVYAGVDYAKILEQAEKEAEIIVWDGGNNDLPFVKPDVLFVVADALRPGHELSYYPGASNFRMADVIIINKVNNADPASIRTIETNSQTINPKAVIIQTASEVFVDSTQKLSGKKAVVVEDGPTVTHGGMSFSAGTVAARSLGLKIIDPRKHAVGSLKKAFEEYPHLGIVLPALGYSKQQLQELEQTLNKTDADVIVAGTPANLSRILKLNKPCITAKYSAREISGSISKTLELFLKKK